MVKPAKLRCFVVASPMSDIESVYAALQSRSLRITLSSHQPSPASDYLYSFIRAVSASDFIVAVLDDKVDERNVYFELGVAAALKKQIIVATRSSLNDIPSDLSSMQIVRITDEKMDGLLFTLDQFVARHTENAQKAQRPQQLREILHESSDVTGISESTSIAAGFLRLEDENRRAAALRCLDQLGERGDALSESELEKLVADALTSTGAQILVPGQFDKRYDLAIWDDRLDRSVGNPLLIEIKRKLPRGDAERRALYERLITKRPMNSGVVLLLLLENPEGDLHATFPVLTLTIEQFLDRLASQPLAKIIRTLRNQAVHTRVGP